MNKNTPQGKHIFTSKGFWTKNGPKMTKMYARKAHFWAKNELISYFCEIF